MDAWTMIALSSLAALIVGALIYAIVRLRTESRSELDGKSTRVVRLLGAPKLFDPLFAKPFTKRETFGWLIFAVIVICAVALT